MTAGVSEERGRPPFLSRALLTGVLFQLPCDRTVLAAWLSRFGPLTLGEVPPGGSADYPVFCEIWFVHDGALSVGRTDMPGSRAVARAAGTYRECMVWVPNVRLAARESSSFVVGMLTDGAVARWADVALGFGYDKRPGRFGLEPDGAVQVLGPSGRTELAFAPAADMASMPAAPDVTVLDRLAAMPLLGVNRRGGFVHSWLERRFADTAHHPIGGTLALSDYLVPGARRSYAVGADPGAGALAFTALSARLTYPRPF